MVIFELQGRKQKAQDWIYVLAIDRTEWLFRNEITLALLLRVEPIPSSMQHSSYFRSGLQSSSLNITWELIRNKNSQSPSQTYQHKDLDKISRQFKCPLNVEKQSTLCVILNPLLMMGLSPQEAKKQSILCSHFTISTQPTLFLSFKSPMYNMISPQFSHHKVIVLCFDILFA